MKLFLIIFLLFIYRGTDGSHSHRPMDWMADLTNDLGVCILQVQSTMQYGNVAFSPYGVASMSVLLFEGATGNTALEIMRVMNLPWNTLLTRIGFRDINRHLQTYFRSDGFLRGLIMSRDDVCFHLSYQKLLRLYGFEEPDKALTYPCTGFVPYTPVTTTYAPSSTVEAVTVSSPGTGNETTTAATASPTTTAPIAASSDNVVTELTQTSQSVTIFNSTTYTPIIAETVTGAQLAEEETGSTSLEKSTYGLTETGERTRLTTNEVEGTSSGDITAAFSNTVTAATVDDKPGGDYMTSTIQAAESNIKEQKITKSTTQKTQIPKTAKPATVSTSPATATASRNASKVNATQSSGNGNVSTSGNRTKTEDKNSNFYGEFDKKNFTTELETDFKLPTGDFFDNETSDETDPVDDAFGGQINVSLIDLYNTTKGLKFPSLKPTLNFTFTKAPPRGAKDTEFDFNNSSAFYSTLVNFIENATQKVKDFIGFEEPEKSTESSVKYGSDRNKQKPQTTSKPATVSTSAANATKSNTTKMMASAANGTLTKNASSAPTLLSNEKNINTSKSIAADATDPRNLPKKSISASNEKSNVAAAVSLNPTVVKRPSNYYNVVSVRQSKSVSSKYDIKGIRARKRHVKRQAPGKGLNPHNLDGQAKNSNRSLGTLTSVGANVNSTFQLRRSLNATASKFPNSRLLIEDYDAHLPPFLTASDSLGLDYRKVRSYGHGHFLPHGMDWFTTYGQNIRVPIFTYSAILPFAYIEDLKSKILEIPLDNPNYSLLLLLPTSGVGVDSVLKSLRKWPIGTIHDYLRGTAVYAAIPKFNIVSHINLRPALYTLGIRDVFHRYRADLSVMSPDARLFVRSIEQVVTIHVDKFPNSAYSVPEKFTDRHFIASQPFLYFVLDRESGVSLVAGIMADPSRQFVKFV